MPGTLYVVATPIGNLEDVTLRALRVLREVSVIAAEDTRRTARLLQHYSISTRTTSLHEHNEWAKAPALIARLEGGASIALVTDAGTPGISDPGAHLVALARQSGIRVEPIPGASAVLAALSAAGFQVRGFLFAGFPPARSNARKKWLEGLRDASNVLVFYEAPHRLVSTLRDLLDIFGDRELLVARELTKAHEELVVRPISTHLHAAPEPRGEYTLVMQGRGESPASLETHLTDGELIDEFGELTNSAGLSRREAIRRLATRHGLSAREVYRRIEEGRSSVD